MHATPQSDPRASITPDSFTVAPELVGLPLARPWRRASAMLVDLLAVALLANAGGVFLAIAAALALWRASAPAQKGGTVRRGVRAMLRFGAALALFVAVVNVVGAIGDDDDDDDGAGAVGVALGGDETDAVLTDLAAIPEFLTVARSGDTAAVRRAAQSLAARVEDDEAREAIATDLADELEEEWRAAIVRDAFGAAPVDTVSSVQGDSAAIAYADAVARGDSVAAEALRAEAGRVVAGERVRSLEASRERLRRDNAELRRELEQREERGGGLTGFIRSIADDLGIGFGWGALYFTAFLAMWRGQTPGKRLFGVRVIRLDGRPISWWIAFERFGGYAASLSTGLLGFVQILWDRNRQGLHDKAVETVVIRDLPPSLRSAAGWQPAGRGRPPRAAAPPQ